MAQGKPQLKFERNPPIKFRDNCDTDGRTTDGRRTKVPSHELCWQSQAELKMPLVNTIDIYQYLLSDLGWHRSFSTSLVCFCNTQTNRTLGYVCSYYVWQNSRFKIYPVTVWTDVSSHRHQWCTKGASLHPRFRSHLKNHETRVTCLHIQCTLAIVWVRHVPLALVNLNFHSTRY